MPTMTQSEIKAFLQAPRHAVVGVNRLDGPPQLSPIWYIYEAGRMYISIGAGTAKHHNLKRDPRISICVDGGRADVRTVIIYGRAEIIGPAQPLQAEMRWRIIRHYYTDEAEAAAYLDSVRDMPAVLLVVTPEKIISQDFN